MAAPTPEAPTSTPVLSSLSTPTTTVTPDPPTVAVAAVTAAPSQTPLTSDYTVAEGDTLWDIALVNGVSLDEMVLANPDINPDLLHPGDVIHIPRGGATPVPPATPVPGQAVAEVQTTGTGTPATVGDTKADSSARARVAADADQLRLRQGPGTSYPIILHLAALTPLTILGRSEDGAWLKVSLSDGTQGWVMAQYVDTGGMTSLSTATLPIQEPYLQNFTTRAQEIYRLGLEMGNRPNVFAVIGDSNSASPLFLEPFDRGDYNLGQFGYLQDTIRYFKGSFTFTSVAAVVGFDTLKLMDPARAVPDECRAGESPLRCEYRRKRPSVALILIGTNDTMNWQNFEVNYRRIVDYTIAQGIVPILITKGDDLESTKYHAPAGYINNIIKRVSQENGVPLLDLHQVNTQLPNNGFGSDGFHFNIAPDGRTADFTGDHMNYGYTIRNLTALQMLDAVRRLIESS